MATAFKSQQMMQLQSFWNLLQTTDEKVQKGLYVLLQQKYSNASDEQHNVAPSFLQMQGILKGSGNDKSDQRMLEEYFNEKYGL